MRRVLVTRSAPGAAQTAARLEALGYAPVLAPMQTIVAVAHDPSLADGAGALAFTSAAGARHWRGRTDLPAYCVGDATADGARDAGFHDVRSAAGDGAALVRLIAATARADDLIVHVRGEEVAADVAGDLVRLGRRAAAIVVFRAQDAETPPIEKLADLHAALFHSPAGAGIFSRIAPPDLDLRGARALALSPAVAARLMAHRWKSVEIAESPQESALLSVLTAAQG